MDKMGDLGGTRKSPNLKGLKLLLSSHRLRFGSAPVHEKATPIIDATPLLRQEAPQRSILYFPENGSLQNPLCWRLSLSSSVFSAIRYPMRCPRPRRPWEGRFNRRNRVVEVYGSGRIIRLDRDSEGSYPRCALRNNGVRVK